MKTCQMYVRDCVKFSSDYAGMYACFDNIVGIGHVCDENSFGMPCSAKGGPWAPWCSGQNPICDWRPDDCQETCSENIPRARPIETARHQASEYAWSSM